MFVSNCAEIFGGGHHFVESSDLINIETGSNLVISSSKDHTAVCSGVTLTIIKASASNTIIAELDFESDLIAVTWDRFTECLVVGDVSGTMHFVTVEGSLLFSKKLPISGSAVFNSFHFLTDDNSPDNQTLIAVLDNGVILGILNLPVQTICLQAKVNPQALTSIFQSLQFLRSSVQLPETTKISKACVFLSYKREETLKTLKVMIITSDHVFCLMDAGSLSALSPSVPFTSLSAALPVSCCVDFYLDNPTDSDLRAVYLLYSDSIFRVVELSTLSVLAAVRLDLVPSMFSTVVTGEGTAHSSLILVSESESSRGEASRVQCLSVVFSGMSVAVLDLGLRPLKHSTNTANVSLVPSSVRSGSSGAIALVAQISGNDTLLYVGHVARALQDLQLGLNYALADEPAPLTATHCIIAEAVRDAVRGSQHRSDHFLQQISKLATCGEVLSVVNVLLNVPNPTAGFIDRLLTVAEGTIEGNKAVRHNDPSKQRCISQLLKLVHQRETAGMVAALSTAATTPVETEEVIRHTVTSLQPRVIVDAVKEFLRRGEIQQVVLVAERHLRGSPQLGTYAVELLAMVPTTAAVADVIVLVRSVLLPALKSSSPSAYHSQVLHLAQNLSRRGTDLERSTSSPFDAKQLVDLAVDLTTSLPLQNVTAAALKEMKTVQYNLQLQQLMRKVWQDDISLSEVGTVGLEALLFDRLDAVEESALLEDVSVNMQTIASALGTDLDIVLKRWVEETVSSRIICAGNNMSDEEREAHLNDEERQFQNTQQFSPGETCTVSRLVLVLSLIRDRNIVAKLALVLFQIPSVENSSLRLTSSQSNASSTSKAGVTQQLCDIAASVCDFVDSATREALVEAMRLLKAKSVAASYGIRSFDPRDAKQIRGAVRIISTSFHRPTCVSDAATFAADWGYSSTDLNSLLTRTVVLRITESAPGSDFEEHVRAMLSTVVSLSSLQVVVEDVMTHLVEALQEVSDKIEYQPSSSDVHLKVCGAQDISENKVWAEALVRGATLVCGHFLDRLREHSSSTSVGAVLDEAGKIDATVGTGRKKPQHTEMASSWVNYELQQTFKRLHSLQTVYGIYLCLSDLEDVSVCKAVIVKLAKFRVAEVLASHHSTDQTSGISDSPAVDSALPLNGHCRRVCLLLQTSPVFFSHTAMKLLVEANHMSLAMEVARSLCSEKTQTVDLITAAAQVADSPSSSGADLAVFDSAEDSALLLDAAMTLCGIAAKKATQVVQEEYTPFPIMSAPVQHAQEEVPEHLAFPVKAFSLSRDLLKGSVSCCQPAFVGRTLDLLCGSELVLSVYERIEGATVVNNTAPAAADSSAHQLQLSLSEGSFSRDGILMQPSAVVSPLMKFALVEVKRRSSNGKAAQSSASDLEELVAVLQRSENHLLAMRAMFSSWSVGAAKAQHLKSSLLSLSRKILIYRDIDTSFAVACLAAIPYETMVRELKSVVPSIQTDFSRLRTVAMVGEELSHLWDQSDLLTLFQGLQTNARWWHILSLYGVKVDLRTFQSPDSVTREAFIRSLIPQLLDKSGMDLEMAVEYCQQFDVEPECALLVYVTILLKASPNSIGDMSWAPKVRSAASRMEEKSVVECLRGVLEQLHPLDYEKIRYVCTWLVDILSLEESNSNEAACNDSADQSVDDTRHRNKISHLSSIAEAMDTYRRYIDIAAYLSGIRFPVDSTSLIRNAADVYKGMAGIYLERIPLWQLLDEPWGIIEPLLMNVPEIAMKLSPLCFPLQLDKNEFNSRRIRATYANMTVASASSADLQTECSPFVRETKKQALQVASESISSTVSDPVQQVAIWRWLFAAERSKDDDVAQSALEAAISITTGLLSSPVVTSTAGSIHAELVADLLTLKCERTVKHFNKYLSETPQVASMLLGLVTNPTELLRQVLEISMELAWDLQLKGLLQFGEMVSCYQMTFSGPPQPVTEFLDVVTATIDSLASQCGLDIVPASVPNAVPQPSAVESIRHGLIGRMLADGESNSEKDSAAAAVSSMSTGFWGFASQSSLSPSEAEMRRRDDLYLSFAIAATVSTCSNTSLRKLYINQLDTVMRSKGGRNSRRMTNRSRFRATQAMVFMRSGVHNAGLLEEVADLDKYRDFLYCLSEMREIRLPCTDETLLLAMGFKSVDSTLVSIHEGTSGQRNAAADPRSLIRTWLHDEGSHTEVVELARDLQLIANPEDEALWYHLLNHMLGKEQHRVLVQSLAMIHQTAVFRDLCFGLMGSDVLSCLAKLNSDAVEKAQQILEVSATKKEAPDWLQCSLDLIPQNQAATTKTTGSGGDSISEVPKVVRKTMLVSRCAYLGGSWEEAPEDIVLSLSHSAQLSAEVFSLLSSRLLSKNTASLAALRKNAVDMLRLAASTKVTAAQSARSVVGAMLRSLQCSGMFLLSPLLVSGADVQAESSSFVLSALNASTAGGSLLSCNLSGVGWRTLETARSRFSREVLLSAMDNFLYSEGSLSRETLCALIRSGVDQWSANPDLASTSVLVLAWCLTRLAASAAAKEAVVGAILSLDSQVKTTLAKMFKTAGFISKIEAAINSKCPSLEALLQ